MRPKKSPEATALPWCPPMPANGCSRFQTEPFCNTWEAATDSEVGSAAAGGCLTHRQPLASVDPHTGPHRGGLPVQLCFHQHPRTVSQSQLPRILDQVH
jgi:hypothetical protein